MIQEILKEIDLKKDQRITEIHKERDEKILVLKEGIKTKIAERSKQEAEALKKESDLLATEFSQKKDTEINFLVQGEKNKLINTVWERAKQKINELPDKEFAKVIESLVKSVPKMEGDVSASKRAYPTVKKILKGMKVKDDLKEEGFVVKGKNLELNFRISEILQQMKEEHNPEIIKILFEE